MTNTVSQSFFRSRWKVFGLLVALLAVALSPFGREAARKIKRERAINHIRKNLGDVQRAEPTFAETTFVERLLRVFYGQESFTAAMSVILNPKQASDLDYLSEISEVKTVTIDCSYVSNEALSESWKFVDPIIVTLKSAVVNEELFGDVARHGKLSLAIFEKCTFDSQGMEKLLLCPQLHFRGSFIGMGSSGEV